MCARSRGGRSRTAPHSGNSRPHRPVRSSDSTTSTSGRPAPSSDSSSASAVRGQGSRSSGAVSARWCRVPAATGSPVRAAVAATRSTSAGSRAAAASRASATSPRCSTTPAASGRRTGGRRSAARPRRGRAARAERRPTSAANAIARAGPGQGPGQVEPVADLQHRGHLVGVLGAEHVAGAPGEAVQLGADVEQQVARLQHLTAGAVEQLGRGERVDQVHVAQPAVAVLQVGLDAVGDLPHLGPAVAGGVGELVEPAPDARAPGLPDGAADGVGQRLVAGDVPGLEQPQRGPQVRRGHLDGLARACARSGRARCRRPTAGTTSARRAARCPCGRRAAARGRGRSTARARDGPARPRRPGPRGR